MKLLNGDSYELMKTLPDNSVDLVLIDPPYEFELGGRGGAFGYDKWDYFMAVKDLCKINDEPKPRKLSGGGAFEPKARSYHSELDFPKVQSRNETSFISKGFDLSILDECRRVLKKDNFYVWCSKKQLSKLLNYFEGHGDFIDLLCWHKTNPIPTCNNTYLSDTEYLVFARESGVKVYGNYHSKFKYWVTPQNKADKKLYKHPTIKPLPIIKTLIENSTLRGGCVLDCFMGSGTTGVACKELDRDFIGIEIDEKFFEIAKNRINEEQQLELDFTRVENETED